MAAAAPSPTPTPDAVSAGGDDDRDESEGDDAGEALSNDALVAEMAGMDVAAVGATSPVSELQFVAVAGRNAFSCTTRVPALNAALAELNRHNEEVNWVALAGTAWVVIYGGGRGYKGVLGKELGEKLTTIVSAGGEITCVSLSMSSNTAGAAATDEWVVVSTTADGSTECSYRLVAARQPLADAAKEVIEFEGGAVDRVALAPDGGWALTWRRRDAVRSYGGARFAISATHHETFKASLAQCMDGVTCIAMAAGGAYSIVGGDGRCLFRATAESVRALKTAVETVGEGGKVTCLAIA